LLRASGLNSGIYQGRERPVVNTAVETIEFQAPNKKVTEKGPDFLFFLNPFQFFSPHALQGNRPGGTKNKNYVLGFQSGGGTKKWPKKKVGFLGKNS